MPNVFAYVALFSWPFITFVLFRLFERPHALIAAILGGYLLLPFGVGVHFTMLPTLDKDSIPAMSAGIMLLFSRSRAADPRRVISRGRTVPELDGGSQRAAPSGPASSPWARRSERVLLILLLLSPIATVLGNAEPYAVGGGITLPGLTMYDAGSIFLQTLVAILPYLLARRYLADARDQHNLLVGVAVAGLVYSLPALFEVRLSPQISRWVYGFLAQSFEQTARDGGFRPVVFLQHGLWLAIFLCMATIAAFTLWRQRTTRRAWLAAGLWLLVTLWLCHSLGAMVISLVALTPVLLLKARGQVLFASAVAIVILSYPALRGAGLVPVEQVASIAGSISADRGGSLQYRLDNENRLLAHANDKPLTGWGSWGRSRVYDTQSGKDISITDGLWIITIGGSGWLGYVAQFGLLTAPLLFLSLRRRHAPSIQAAGLAIILASNLADMIPNATLTPVTWLIAGSLAGTYAKRSSAFPYQQPSPRSSDRFAARRRKATGTEKAGTKIQDTRPENRGWTNVVGASPFSRSGPGAVAWPSWLAIHPPAGRRSMWQKREEARAASLPREITKLAGMGPEQ